MKDAVAENDKTVTEWPETSVPRDSRDEISKKHENFNVNELWLQTWSEASVPSTR